MLALEHLAQLVGSVKVQGERYQLSEIAMARQAVRSGRDALVDV